MRDSYSRKYDEIGHTSEFGILDSVQEKNMLLN